MDKVELRTLETIEELERCMAIEMQIWGQGVVPTGILRAATHMGGLAIGAFIGDELAGFVFGFLGRRKLGGVDHWLHHSHVLGVLPQWRGRGIGAKLKREQARLCLESGIELMTWTFDPLRATNAYQNLEKLGATTSIYQVRHYGVMADAQNADLDSDRLLVTWWLSRERTAPTRNGDVESALTAGPDGLPGSTRLKLDDPEVLVAVPNDFDVVLATAPSVAVAWREAVRDVMLHYFDRGYEAVGFRNRSYVLRRA